MRTKRLRETDRRHQQAMPGVPSKVRVEATITKSRRRVPDRRLNNIEVEWIDEGMIR